MIKNNNKNQLNYVISLTERFLDNTESIEEILEEWNEEWKHGVDDTFYEAFPYVLRLYEEFQHYFSDSDIREKDKSYDEYQINLIKELLIELQKYKEREYMLSLLL